MELKKFMETQRDLAAAGGWLGTAETWQNRINALPWVDADVAALFDRMPGTGK
jgi:hypothetical protein